ncbi:MAG: YceI family protein [Armatimonadetes bacterium]|nr:YceI family protein [Armatimonadota bacterium]
MHKFDNGSAEVFVFTYKEGLLSAVAHDLKIRVNDFEITVDEENNDLTARFNPASLQVVNAMKEGRDTPGTPGDNDKKTIQDTIQNDVLHTKKFGEITFELEAHRAAGDGYQIKGDLNLHGQKKSVMVDVRQENGHFVAETTLHQPDFGIKPYSAMMGTLKIKPDVKIQVRVPRW